MATEGKIWFLRPWPRWIALRDVPLRRLWVLFVAAFLLFSVIGYYTDLLNDGNTPVVVVFVVAVYSGLNACTWIYATMRWPMVAILPIALLQIFNGAILSAISRWLIVRFGLHSPSTKEGIHFAATGIFVSIIASYSFFLRFIRVELNASVRLENELDLAHGMQKTLVPTIHLRTPRFEVYGISRPSERVGGDLVDAITLSSGDVVAYLADIAGHGLPASILMGRLKTATRTAVLECGTSQPQQLLSLLLHRLNVVLPQVKEPNLYATFTGFRLGVDGSVFYALAASPPVLWWSAGERRVTQIGDPQLPVGLLPVSHFDCVLVRAAPGDLFVVATDGILEAANKQAEEFGVGRLQQLVTTHAGAPLPTLAETILAAAGAFGRQFDDQTMLLIRCL